MRRIAQGGIECQVGDPMCRTASHIAPLLAGGTSATAAPGRLALLAIALALESLGLEHFGGFEGLLTTALFIVGLRPLVRCPGTRRSSCTTLTFFLTFGRSAIVIAI